MSAKTERRVFNAAMRWADTHSNCVGFRKSENLIAHFQRCPYHGNTVKLLKACAAHARGKQPRRKG